MSRLPIFQSYRLFVGLIGIECLDMLNMKRLLIVPCLLFLFISGLQADQPVEDRGIYALWYADDLSILETPYVTGGQIVCQWREVEKAPGTYDFSVVPEPSSS